MNYHFMGHTTFGGPEIVAQAVRSYIPTMERALPGVRIKVDVDSDRVVLRFRPCVGGAAFGYLHYLSGPILECAHLRAILREACCEYVSGIFNREGTA